MRPQLALGGQPLQGSALQHAVLGQIVEHLSLEAEEAAVDPVLRARLLVKADHAPVVLKLRHAELQLGAHHRHRGERAVALVEREQRL